MQLGHLGLWGLLALAVCLTAESAAARDEGADGNFTKRTSSHFILYQDVDIDESGGLHGSRRFEQQILAELERAYDRLDDLIGLRPPRKVDVVIYDPILFDQQFAGFFRFAAAGFYHGVIRIRGATQLHVGLSAVLHHELVHAAFDAAAPSYVLPGWINEGVAEWFEARTQGKRHLSPGQLGYLQQADGQGVLFSLEQLSLPSFGDFSRNAATLAYVQSYGLVEFLAREYGEGSIREFCLELARTRNLERSLKRVFNINSAALEERFVRDLR